MQPYLTLSTFNCISCQNIQYLYSLKCLHQQNVFKMDLLSFQETQQESYSSRGPTSSKSNVEDGVSHERPSSLPVSDGSASQSAPRFPLRPAAGDFRAYVCVLTGVISSCGHSHVRPHAQENIRTGTDSLANPRTRADPARHACGNSASRLSGGGVEECGQGDL